MGILSELFEPAGGLNWLLARAFCCSAIEGRFHRVLPRFSGGRGPGEQPASPTHRGRSVSSHFSNCEAGCTSSLPARHTDLCILQQVQRMA